MKPGTIIRKVLAIIPFLALSVVVALPITPATSEAVLFIDATGGDCALVGEWKGTTCTLMQDIIVPDIMDGIHVMADGITIDGAGHLLMGMPGDYPSAGVYLLGRTGVTVKDLHIEGFFMGILLEGSPGNTLMHNESAYNYYAMRLSGSDGNTIVGNVCYENDAGIFLYGNHWMYPGNRTNLITGNRSFSNGCCGITLCGFGNDDNVILGNTVFGMDYFGILMHEPGLRNTVKANIVSGNGQAGLFMFAGADESTVMNNDFVENNRQLFTNATMTTYAENYWSSFDEPLEGCDDLDEDGVCDAPYVPEVCSNDYDGSSACVTTQYGGEDALASPYSRVLGAALEVRPFTIKANSTVKVYIEIPGYDLALIDLRTVAVHTELGMVWAETTGSMVGDIDKDKVPDLMVKIDTAKFMTIVNTGNNIPVWVTAVIGDRTLEGADFVNVVK